MNNLLRKKTFYAQLKPNFNETDNWIRNQEEADEMAKVLDKFVSEMKKKCKQRKKTVGDSTIYF